MQAGQEFVLRNNRLGTIGLPMYVEIINVWTDLKPLRHMVLARGNKDIMMSESHFKVYYEKE